MTIYAAPFAGDLDFEPNEYDRWYFNVNLPSGHYDFNINLKSGELADGLSKARRAFPDLARLDQAARDGIRTEFNAEPSNSAYFVRYFQERYSAEELADLFETKHPEIGVDKLLAAIKLVGIRINLGDDEDPLVLDYKLQGIHNDQILVVYIGLTGHAEAVRMES